MIKHSPAGDTPAERAALKEWLQAPDDHRRYFEIGFREGNSRVVFPADNDPLSLKQQIISTPLEGLQIMDSKMAGVAELIARREKVQRKFLPKRAKN
jgi:hypothetical protein